MLIPFLSCGSFVGTLLVNTMPKIITVICIIITMLFSITKSSIKLKELWKKEVQTNNPSNVNDFTVVDIELADIELSQKSHYSHCSQCSQHNQEEQYQQNIKNIELPSNSTGDSYKSIALYLFILLLIVIVEGAFSLGRKFVRMCGNEYIFICIAQILLTVFLGYSVYKFVLSDRENKQKRNYEFDSGDIEPTTKHFSFLALFGTFVSIISSWNGTGGGVMLNPILLSIGLTPSSVIATSCNFIWLGSLSSLVNFAIFGQITWKYSIMLGTCAILGTICGLNTYSYIVNKIKKQSLLVMFLIFVAVLSICLLVAGSITDNSLSNFSIKNVCGS